VKLTGDSPPTEQELHQIFAKLGAEPQAEPTTGENIRSALQWGGKAIAGMMGMGAAGREAVENPGMTLATAALPGAVTAAKAALPSAARAGAKFQSVMGAAKDVPIDISGPGNQALRIMQLGERGGTIPKAVRDFVKRVTDPNKPDMTYDEARDFASNISRLSADEFSRLPRGMRREVGNLRVALNKSVERAADAAGKGDEYRSAMKEYSRAAKGREMVDDVKEQAMRWAVPVGLTGYGLNKASDLLKSQD
jgi:hypothetical protein